MDRRTMLASLSAMPFAASSCATTQAADSARPKGKQINSVDAAMALAAHEAVQAKCKGTYGVGGVLIDSRNGAVLKGLHNAVARDGLLRDVTAHGERQLIDWYFAQPAGTLPSPQDVTLVTSLDPCGMCTGAALAAGFKVVVGAYDGFAGINFDRTATFGSLPPTLQRAVASNFSYPEVTGDGCYARLASGAPLSAALFTSRTVDGNTQALCDTVFEVSRAAVRSLIDTATQPSDFLDLRNLDGDSPIVAALRAIYPQALEYRSGRRHGPDAGLAPFLRQAMNHDRHNGGAGNAVAYLDYFGNLLMCLPGQVASSRIHTAFMSCTRAYTKLRADLTDAKIADGRRYLHHPRYGAFVFAIGPGLDALGLMEVSAMANTLGSELPLANPAPFQYVRPSVPHAELAKFCSNLPPFYSKFVKLQPTRVSDAQLVNALQAS